MNQNTKRMKRMGLLLCLILLAGPLHAQKHIAKWIGSCEKEMSLDMSRVERRDPVDGKICRVLREVALEKGNPLYDAFFSALEQDLPAAETVERRRSGGVERIVSCRFVPAGASELIALLIEYPQAERIVVKIDHRYCFYGG